MAEEKKQDKKGGGRKKESALTYKVAAPGTVKVSPSHEPRLKTKYEKEVVPALLKEFGFENKMGIPHIEKIEINCGVKEAVGNPKVVDSAVNDLTVISGQKAVVTRARKSIATFKVREGIPLGARVTLRRARMYEFLDRLMNVALPRVRDFRGVSPKAFDGRGNYSLGIKEQIIFPEIDYDKLDAVRGLTITIVTSAKKNEHARALLAHLGMPFRK